MNDFEIGTRMDELVEPKQGMATTDNKKYLRQWFEVNILNIKFNASSLQEAKLSGLKWFPYNKGGSYRKWYGNYDYVVNYQNDGKEIKHDVLNKYKYLKTPDFVVKNTQYYFQEAITWSLITSGGFSLRIRNTGSIHDVAGMSAFSDSHQKLVTILSVMNSPIGNYILKMLNPTINLQVGDFNNFPIKHKVFTDNFITNISESNISISKSDWDSFETSWDFTTHPFMKHIAEHKQKIYLNFSQNYGNVPILSQNLVMEVQNG